MAIFSDPKFWLMIPTAGWALVSLFNFFFKKRVPKNETAINVKFPHYNILSLQNGVSIKKYFPDYIKLKSKHKTQKGNYWFVLVAILMIISVILLVFDSVLIFALINNTSNIKIDNTAIVFLMFTIGLPLYSIFDVTFVQLPVIRRGYSAVAWLAIIRVEGDSTELLNICQNIASVIGGKITHLDTKSGIVQMELNKNVMLIKIERQKAHHNRIFIVSDSELLTVRLDFGRNKRNVDCFIDKFMHPVI